MQLWPGFLPYLASFVTIGVIWLNHHAVFAKIAAVDQTVQWSNLLLLLTYGDARAKVDQLVVVNVHQNASASTRDIDARPFAVPGDLDPADSADSVMWDLVGEVTTRPAVNSSSSASADIVEVGQLDVDLRS